MEHAEEWPQLLAVCAWFRDHPRPGIYLRQLDIPGVDTKFIESRRRLLGELLDLVLPAEAVDTRYTGARGFEARYGLRQAPTRVRLRLLDPELAIRGLTDLAVPVEELARLDLAAHRHLCVPDPRGEPGAAPPERLTHEEAATFAELQAGDAKAGPLRLEQERIGMGWAEGRIRGSRWYYQL
nr:DUF3322 domain-containing protein [Halorhodospira neutriphila]